VERFAGLQVETAILEFVFHCVPGLLVAILVKLAELAEKA
jgi:hypothetical protein